MYISLNWIRDYVDLNGIEETNLIERFFLSTAEIENVEHKGENIQGVIFAKITKVEAHPNSQKLHILNVFDGAENWQVVCGAPNVKENMITAFAPLKSVVAGHKISKAKLAGVESFGMCCSENELGIGSDDNGIMEITDDVTLGTSIKDYFPIDDTILEIDNKSLTNRPDLWGHYGIAREFSTIFKRELKPLKTFDVLKYNTLPKIKIEINDENCLRYSGITVDNIKTNTSPQWLKIRLGYTGMRDINLLTDLTNYLMLELGQPMHAFDNEKVKGIIVKPSNENQTMLTLEGEEHKLNNGNMIICDQNETPIAIAGIKGGLLSGINKDTTSLLLESACFDATSIRKTSTQIGLKTDSSMRYEKSLDPELTTIAIKRLLFLLNQIEPKMNITSALSDVYKKKYERNKIKFTKNFLEKRIGSNLDKNNIEEILKYLGFEIIKSGDEFEVIPPSFRATKDISIKEDIVEEIARMYGYDNISPKTLVGEIRPTDVDFVHDKEYKTKLILSEKYNLNEIHSYIWNYKDFNDEFGIETKSHLSLLDSSNSGQSGIRSELSPTMIKTFFENKNNFDEIGIYEIGRVVLGLDQNKLAIEKRKLSILLASTKSSEKDLYFKLKKILLDICQTVVNASICLEQPTTVNYLNPLNSCKIISNNYILGTMGLLHPLISFKLDKRFKIAILEIDFDDLCNKTEKIKYQLEKITKYQTVSLDFNFNIPMEVSYSKVEEIIKSFHSKLKFNFKLSDIYKDTKNNKQYWTFSFNIYSLERTLNSEDIEKFSNRLISHMAQNSIDLKQ